MSQILSLTKRNLKVYLKDRSAVFFSLLSVIILIGVYLLFIGNNTQGWLTDMVGDSQWIKYLSDTNIMAGVLVVSSITVSLGIFGNMVTDKENGKLKGLLITPAKSYKILLSYILSAWVATFFLTMLLLLFVQLYILSNGGLLMNLSTFLKITALIIFNVLTASAFSFFIVSFIKSINAFGTVASIVGTLIGFICGIYIPLAVLPNFVQKLSLLIPFTYNTILTRQVFSSQATKLAFEGLPADAIEELNLYLGTANPVIFGVEINAFFMLLGIAVMASIFMFFAYKIINRRLSQ